MEGKNKEIDHRSDIFSFGCILFEAVTRSRPFEDESVIKTLHKVIFEPAPPIADLNPSAPSDLQRIVRRCLAKDRDERYQTIKDVAIELKELRRELESRPIESKFGSPTKGEASELAATKSTTSDSVVDTTNIPSSELQTRASSAEFLVSRLKQHKLAVLLALLILSASITALALYLRPRTNEVAINSIAVMPFVYDSGNADIEYLSDGMTETLINSLSQFALGDKERAMVELNKTYDDRLFYTAWIKADPLLDPLRDYPPFQELLRRVGFPP